MKKIISCLAIAAVASCLFAPQAQARPDYLKGLQGAYADNTAIGEKKCGVCHGHGGDGKDKKVLNDYGKALGEAIGAKNCKDADKIKAGVKKAGEKKEGDATYDSILKGGKLPKAAE